VNELDYQEIWGVEVTDPNADSTTSPDTVTVSLTSNVDSTTIELVETGPQTGIFGGVSSSAVIFMTGEHRVTLGNLELFQDYTADCDFCNAGTIDQVSLQARSTSDPAGFAIILDETGIDTKIFEGTLRLSPGTTVVGTSLQAKQGDFVTLQTIGSATSDIRMQVIPPTQSRAAIQMEFPETGIPDVVQITYKDSTATLDPKDEKGGGGGGGLVRPGLVVNVLAGAAGGGGGPPGPTLTLCAVASSDSGSETISMPQEIRDILNDNCGHTHIPLEPIADIYQDFDLPLSINGNGFVLGGYENTLVPQTVRPGEPVEFVLVFYTTSEVAHVSLNFNLGPTRTIAGSDTQVLLYKDKPAEIIDPNGNIATATGSINNEGELKRVATFSITWSDDIQWSNSDLVIR